MGARHGRVLVVGAVVAMALLAGACGASEESSGGDDVTDATSELPRVGAGEDEVNLVTDAGEPKAGGELVYGVTAESDGWNPILSRWSPAALQVARSVFDLLVTIDADGMWQPELAESFEANDDNTVWTITVRDGVTFHDGTPFDAQELLDYLTLLRESPLVGVTMYFVEDMAVEGDTVVVRMIQPWATFPYIFATQLGAVGEPTWVASSSPADPVGTGPFVMTEWTPGERTVVDRFDGYWQAGYPYLDRIEFQAFEDMNDRLTRLDSGELDVIQVNRGVDLARVRAGADRGDLQLACGLESIESFMMLNTAVPPFDDPALRQAVALVTDTVGFTEALGGGEDLPAAGPYEPGSYWYTETDYPAYDPEAARALVDEIAAEQGGPVQVTILANDGTQSATTIELVAEQWEAVGIEVTAEQIDQTLMIRNTLFGDFEAVVWQQFDALHPINDTIWWHPRAANPPPELALNFARNDDPELGALLDDIIDLEDREDQRAGYAEVQELVNRAIPYVWLSHTKQCVAASTTVVDLVTWSTPGGVPGMSLINGAHPLWQVWLDR